MEKLKFLIIPVMFIYFLVQNDNYSPKKIKLLPLQGAELQQLLPRALPWARSFCPFRACRENQASTLPHQLVNVVLKHSDTAAFFIH